MKNILCTTLLCSALLIWPAQHITNPAIVHAATVTYQTTATVNVRAGAGTSYKVLGKLKKGKTITVKKTVGAWYKISFNGKAGYVSASYVKVIKPTEKPTHMTTARVNVRAGAGTNYKVTDKLLTLLANSKHEATLKNSYTSYLQPGTYKMTLSWASSQSAGRVLVTDKHGNIQLDEPLTKHRSLNVYTIQVDERTAITLTNFNATLTQP